MSLFSKLAAIKAALVRRSVAKTTGYLRIVCDCGSLRRECTIRIYVGCNSEFFNFRSTYRAGLAVLRDWLPPKHYKRVERDYKHMLIKYISRACLANVVGLHGVLYVRPDLCSDRVYLETDYMSIPKVPLNISFDCGDRRLAVDWIDIPSSFKLTGVPLSEESFYDHT